MSKTEYDKVPYPSYTHPQTHPERLAVLALLHGMTPAPVERCRVLELGCGSGNNILPMAWALPGSQFVGLDLAGTPIEQGQAMAAELGVQNLRLEQADVAAVDRRYGVFDYVIAHGLYSWVPAPVRERILAVIREVLAPQGVAFISYSALPGGHLRNMLREMMLMHVRGFESPEEKMQQATALLRFLAGSRDSQDPYRAWLHHELETVLGHEPGHLYHDELAPCNEPCYFSDFVRQAEAHGLQFLSEADYFEMFDHGFTPSLKETLARLSRTRVLKEQYLDFLKCRRFRQTLLCQGSVRLETEPRREVVRGFSVSGNCVSDPAPPDLAPGVTTRFRSPRGARCETDYVLGKAALSLLAESWPMPVGFDRLLTEAAVRARLAPPAARAQQEEEFSSFLLSLYAGGLVDFTLSTRGAAAAVGERPAASAIARWQAQRGVFATSLFHIAVRLEDEVSRALLGWLDGTRTREQLLDLLWQFLQAKQALDLKGKPAAEVRRELAARLEENLQKLARMGLLVQSVPALPR